MAKKNTTNNAGGKKQGTAKGKANTGVGKSGIGNQVVKAVKATVKSVKKGISDAIVNCGQPKEFHFPSAPVLPARVEATNPSERPSPPQLDRRILGVIADLATCLWDIERKIRPDAGETVPMKLKIAHRRAQRSLDNLKQAQFRIQDYRVGDPFGSGDSGLKVHLQPTENATSETISDTVSPTIYYKDIPIQMGEVWVSIPPEVKRPATTHQAPLPTAATPATPDLDSHPPVQQDQEASKPGTPLAGMEPNAGTSDPVNAGPRIATAGSNAGTNEPVPASRDIAVAEPNAGASDPANTGIGTAEAVPNADSRLQEAVVVPTRGPISDEIPQRSSDSNEEKT